MNDHPLFIHLPVWEPAGQDVCLSEKDLLQHLLILGATGSGKTTLLQRITEQVIAHCPQSKPQKSGLVIFDAKGDDTVKRVKRAASASGRNQDVVVIGQGGTHFVDLFSALNSLDAVDLMARRLLSGCRPLGLDNAFWEETRYALIDAALTILALRPGRVGFSEAMRFFQEWFFKTDTTQLEETVNKIGHSLESMTGVETRKFLQAMEMVNLWKALDPRTKAILQSTLMNTLRPLLSVPAGDCFEAHGRPAFALSQVVRDGLICIVCVNSLTQPDLAGLLFKLVKSDFYRAVHARKDDRQRLCGIVADELPLLATPDDQDALATVRVRRCFVASASQGFSILDERLGFRTRRALLANFGSIIFLRSREEEVDQFAAVHLGTYDQSITIPLYPISDMGTLPFPSPPHFKMRRTRQVCPPGTLGQLPPHTGFVATPNSARCLLARTFIPWFEPVPTGEKLA